MDTLEGMSDLFVKCWPESCTPQETDTHWRAKKGNAAFAACYPGGAVGACITVRVVCAAVCLI
jgi:hypothetical protein